MFVMQALMPPLPEEADDDTLTPAVSKHGADAALPSQQQQPLASQAAPAPAAPTLTAEPVRLET